VPALTSASPVFLVWMGQAQKQATPFVEGRVPESGLGCLHSSLHAGELLNSSYCGAQLLFRLRELIRLGLVPAALHTVSTSSSTIRVISPCLIAKVNK
jgi:hypothetical protein